jgi:hypothetical protein
MQGGGTFFTQEKECVSMRLSALRAIGLVLAVGVAACGSDDPVGPSDAAAMSARIDGQVWSPSFAVATVPPTSSGFAAVSSSDGTTTIGFAFPGAAGTYEIGASTGTNGNLTIGSVTWVASAGVGSGTIVVTSLTSERVTGTFEFTMAASGATPATRVVTNGQFDVEL